ncbi:hypothetical protein [Bordetella sp. FB-8]|uniref:hypothetical protein n=1 Tax=Bordetella sp. FB-8 TaxID=1159870 RepID=UPI000382F138|nr:hypothetical protein [Bordetella sp. FB-8]
MSSADVLIRLALVADLGPDSVCRRTADQYAAEADSFYSDAFWQAGLRLLENDKPDYRS